ncbi:cadherin-11 precursor, partial [Silurus asotus]
MAQASNSFLSRSSGRRDPQESFVPVLSDESVLYSAHDSTATIVSIRKSYSRSTQDVYALPIEISDNGVPPLSSTNTLLIRVCSCDSKYNILSCNVEPLFLPAGLSTGALIAILACIVILL